MRAEGPSTSDTTPLQSTALCIFPFTGSTGGDLLAWLMLLLRRSRGLWGTNSEPLLLSLSPKMLCSSSANSVSDPRSLPRPLKLKRLVLLLRLAENKDPRMLSGDWLGVDSLFSLARWCPSTPRWKLFFRMLSSDPDLDSFSSSPFSSPLDSFCFFFLSSVSSLLGTL